LIEIWLITHVLHKLATKKVLKSLLRTSSSFLLLCAESEFDRKIVLLRQDFEISKNNVNRNVLGNEKFRSCLTSIQSTIFQEKKGGLIQTKIDLKDEY